MKKDVIICISREFGSGGKEVGEILSQKLGIPVYDKEILTKVADESGMTEEFVESHEGNPVYSHILGVPMGHPVLGAEYDGIMTPEKLFITQTKVIRKIAQEQKSCIFVGRCADVILQGYENCYRFFIHRPQEDRIRRIQQTENVTEKKAMKMIRKADKERSSYHNYYTGIKWGHPSNYDLIINVDKSGLEKAAKVIINYIEDES